MFIHALDLDLGPEEQIGFMDVEEEVKGKEMVVGS